MKSKGQCLDGVRAATSAGSRINKRRAAATQLELETGPGCSGVHQEQGALPGAAARTRCLSVLSSAAGLLSTWRSARRLCRGEGGRRMNRGPQESLKCATASPVPPRTSRGPATAQPIRAPKPPPYPAWNESKLQRKHTCSLPWPASTASLPGRLAVTPSRDPWKCGLCGLRDDDGPKYSCLALGCEGVQSWLHHDHKPCAVSRGQFCQRAA